MSNEELANSSAGDVQNETVLKMLFRFNTFRQTMRDHFQPTGSRRGRSVELRNEKVSVSEDGRVNKTGT